MDLNVIGEQELRFLQKVQISPERLTRETRDCFQEVPSVGAELIYARKGERSLLARAWNVKYSAVGRFKQLRCG